MSLSEGKLAVCHEQAPSEGSGPTEAINYHLRHHQADAEDWGFSDLANDLHLWGERMIFEFKLQIGTPVLMVARLRRGRLGHYRRGRNAFGLRDEIAIDQSHAEESAYCRVLITLAHELIHSWQEHHGSPPSRRSFNYHNREFRNKAESLGLIVDSRGHTHCSPGDTPFLLLLKKYDVAVVETGEPRLALAQPSRSKLTLYECACGVKARVGRSRFNAKCLDCGTLFRKKS